MDLHLKLNCELLNSLGLDAYLAGPQFSHHKAVITTPTPQGGCEIKGDMDE